MTASSESQPRPGDHIWKRLSAAEKEHLRRISNRPGQERYRLLLKRGETYERTLMTLAELEASLTAAEIAYLLAVRHAVFVDTAAVGRKIGKAIRAGYVRETPGRRYTLTAEGKAWLEQLIA